MAVETLKQPIISDAQISNMRERAKIWAECETDLMMQAAHKKWCSEGTPKGPNGEPGESGFVHWFKYFCWVYEPRNPEAYRKLPFLLWDVQVREINHLHDCIIAGEGVVGDPTNLCYLKSRDMGVTWLLLCYFVWDWLFHGGSYLVGSRKEEEVEKIGDMGTLFEKMRWLIRNMPMWMLPEGFIERNCFKERLIINPKGGDISGEASTGSFGRSDRRKAVLFDEFGDWEEDFDAWASAAGSTNVRIALGTPRGPHNKFGTLARRKCEEEVDVRRIGWWEHPLKNRGLKKIDGHYWSPWYERERKKMGKDVAARELDLDLNTSTKGRVFKRYGRLHMVQNLQPWPGLPIIRIFDPGRTFAVLFIQIHPDGMVKCLRELVVGEAKIRDVGKAVQTISANEFPDYDFVDYGDPAGSWLTGSAQEDPEYTVLQQEFQIFVQFEFLAKIPNKFKTKLKHEAIDKVLITNNGDEMGFQVDINRCLNLHEALEGGYRWKTDKTGNELEVPEGKHPYEDVIDCLSYGIIGGGDASYSTRSKQGKPKEEDVEDKVAQDEPDYGWVNMSR